ncbi:tyrosine-protein phosphatase [Demequina mangrovi]|uniref:Tyrosine phosphatase family protein n=1 Tax=Demequina mangrovi TaxID=1043493 RepID=A0A1H6X2K4_9MICO|nr:tyrosine-protein phosphatase [Demequina mangrovi]SEJ23329.1 Tyrosine phosphatase family protein [Demequina mangrovi]
MTAETLTALANARDVAHAAPGLRPGRLFRSDAPLAGDDAPEGLSPWPPATVVDLRDARESRGGHPFAESARVHAMPVLAEAALDASHAGVTLVELYQGMITGEPGRTVARVVAAMATEPGPVLVHCSAGKDRTGVSVALVLSLVGVEREHIVADYVATSANMRGVLARMAAAWGGATPGLPEGVDPTQIPAEMITAPAPAIGSVLDTWAAAGGAEAWFLAHGGTAEDIEALKERLLG